MLRTTVKPLEKRATSPHGEYESSTARCEDRLTTTTAVAFVFSHQDQPFFSSGTCSQVNILRFFGHSPDRLSSRFNFFIWSQNGTGCNSQFSRMDRAYSVQPSRDVVRVVQSGRSSAGLKQTMPSILRIPPPGCISCTRRFLPPERHTSISTQPPQASEVIRHIYSPC